MLGGKILEFIHICQIAPHKSYTRATPCNGEGRAQNASDWAFIRECQRPLSWHIHWLTSQAIIILNPSAALTKQTTLAYNALFPDFRDTLLSRFFFIPFAGFSFGSSCNISGPQSCSSCLHASNICGRCSQVTHGKCPHLPEVLGCLTVRCWETRKPFCWD